MTLENKRDIPASGDIWLKNIFPFQNSSNRSQERARKASALTPNPLLTLAHVPLPGARAAPGRGAGRAAPSPTAAGSSKPRTTKYLLLRGPGQKDGQDGKAPRRRPRARGRAARQRKGRERSGDTDARAQLLAALGWGRGGRARPSAGSPRADVSGCRARGFA